MGYAPLNDHWIANNVGKLLWLSSNFWGYLVPSVSYCQIINPIYQIPILYLYDIIIFLSFPIYFFHFLGFCQVAGLPSPSRLVASRQQWGPNWELHTARAQRPTRSGRPCRAETEVLSPWWCSETLKGLEISESHIVIQGRDLQESVLQKKTKMETCCSLVAWNRPIPPVTNATSWTTLDNFIQVCTQGSILRQVFQPPRQILHWSHRSCFLLGQQQRWKEQQK